MFQKHRPGFEPLERVASIHPIAGVSTPPVVTYTGLQSCAGSSVNAGPSGIIVCSGEPGDLPCGGPGLTSLTGACLQCLQVGASAFGCNWSSDSTVLLIQQPLVQPKLERWARAHQECPPWLHLSWMLPRSR
eukprot:scaffold35137_cov70-Attheya_sp.AAC.4